MEKLLPLVFSIAALGILPAGAQELAPRTASPHGELKIACENCHTTTAWKPMRRELEFDHNRQTSFPLQGLHQDVACQSCHVSLVFSGAPTRCGECHADLHRRQFGADCEKCHSVRGWDVAISAIQQHNNRFPLLGAHAVATCDQCHFGAATGVYTGLSTECVSCHLKDYQQATPLNHVAAKLPTTCETCHTVNLWAGARFNHNQFTSFALTGAHATVACTQCHVGNRYAGTPVACYGCHANDFIGTTNPSHVQAAFPQTCESCHTTSTWLGSVFDHNKLTSFPLTGMHTSVTCAQCHVGGKFAGTATTCVGCHLLDYAQTNNPNHVAGNFSTTCETCHNTSGWPNATFDHNLSSFKLTGAHTTVTCAQCHLNGNFVTAPTACVGCHLTDFQNTNAPNHVAANFPQTCETCHTTQPGWGGATFDHTTTGFTLTGAHNSLQCNQCHTPTFGNYSIPNGACWNCHQTDYKNANNPNHAAANFPQTCETCHTTQPGWGGATFNHTSTGFALTNAHTTLQCAQCHNAQFGNYSITSGACANCHMTDYNGTTNPAHKAANFPTACDGCHTTVAGWGGASFNHTSTGFPLTNAHTSLACQQCHTSQFGGYSISSGACSNCHMTDYNSTTNPAHKAANFPLTCDQCHTTVAGWGGSTFNHSATGFTLTGAHTTVQCLQCHASQFGGYSITSGDCASCHMTDYNKTTNPAHKSANFPTGCDGCHSMAPGWGGASFNHTTTGFALTGAHTSVQCQQCHTSQFGGYSISSGACANCHMADFNRTNNPSHMAAGFPTTCDTCHTTVAGWGGATFNHTTTGFTLTGGHTSLACQQCHTAQFGGYSITSGACANCHMTDFNNTTNPGHKAAGFPTTCDTCHTTTPGWGGATFNHSSTGFTLTGGHTSLQCQQCHTTQFGGYSITSGACANCHMTDYNGTTNPAHKAANFPLTCDTCHTTTPGWGGATFNHSSTGFTLTNAHTTLQCAQCHNAQFGNYSITSGACANCHMTDYNGTTNPGHKAANFPVTCDTCHTTVAGWGGATFNHSSTGFALTNAHATLPCAQCHTTQFGGYSITSGACANCHMTDYNNTTSPAHKAANFPVTCDQCHTTVAGWGGATFNHATTGFALTNAHTSVACTSCHTAQFGGYSITSGACANCHMTDYNNTTSPAHKAANFPLTCDQCHTTVAGWGGATFNHTSTGFQLTGAHTSVQCNQCHTPAFGNYSIPNGACANCHMADYKGTTSPNHVQANFPTTCDSCHTTVAGWGGATFNHATTGFQLTNGHANLQCVQCHTATLGYTIPNGACAQCHMADYNGTNSPPHAAAGFPTTCDSCHSTVAGWGGATFNHPTTPMQLTGYHATMLANSQCTLCHVNNNYTLSYTGCYSCHQADYNGTNAPSHTAVGFPTTCDSCHSTTNWSGATFNHPTTPFALTGYHATMLANNQCTLCHVSNNYNLSYTGCYSCHQADYNGTTSPAHAAAGFPQTCDTCHSTTNWSGATFSHPTTPLALTGYHATMLANNQCSLCHVGNSYTNTPSTCVPCHQTDYNNTTNPNHAAVSFPTTCNTCHTFTDWTGATYTAHDSAYFKIYSGRHNGKWTACSDCHSNASNYSVFTCIACHQHNNQTSVTSQHSGVKNFVYNATSCYGCHSTV